MKARFSQSAPTYNNAANVQKESAELLLQKIHGLIKSPKLATDLGTGTGQVPKLLLKTYPDIFIDCCDISTTMLNVLRQEIPQKEQISIHHCSLPPRKGYDLITSNFSLQWFPSAGETIDRCISALKTGGFMALSLPVADTFDHLQEAVRKAQVDISLPELPRKEEILKLFPEAGILQNETIELYDNYPNTLEFLRGLHKIGAIKEGQSTPIADLRKLIKIHDELFAGPITAKYKILQIIYKRS